MDEKIAIIGLSGIFPAARDLDTYWSNITNKIDTITPMPDTHWQASAYLDPDPGKADHVQVARGGFLPRIDFNPLEFGVTPKAMAAIDTSQLLSLVVAGRALTDAGYGPERDFDRNRVSVIYGVTGAQELVIPLGARLGHPIWRAALQRAGIDAELADRIVSDISNSYVSWQESSFPGLLGNVVAGRIANRFDLGGTNCVVDAACASSLSALHLACLELQAKTCDMVVTGGVDTFNDIFMYMCFSQTQALALDGRAKPYDRAADGTSLGEGAGALILKRYPDAVRDNDPIHAVICGIGTASDGKGHAIYEPSAAGQVRALQNAYRNAEVIPATIELIEGHGTGTRVGDQIELQALTAVFRDTAKRKWCALGSVKSQIGHTKAAAGIAGIIKAVLALKHKTLPPTINCSDPHELVVAASSPFFINTEARSWPQASHPRRAGVSSFGFGGSNFHCLLEESHVNVPTRSLKHEATGNGSGFTITISGANPKPQAEKPVVVQKPKQGDDKGVDLPEVNTDNGELWIGRGTSERIRITHPMNEQVIAALRDIQTRTADLHDKFLAGQKLALQTLSRILDQQSSSPPQTVSQPAFAQPAPIEEVKSGASETEANKLANGYATDVPDETDALKTALLAVVAEKTGYPQDMINLDMKIEEDLGIDSIKRVEILSALKDKHPTLQTMDDNLVTARSLNDILQFCTAEKKKQHPSTTNSL